MKWRRKENETEWIFGAAESRAAGAAECRNAYRVAVYAGHAANVIASARMGILALQLYG